MKQDSHNGSDPLRVLHFFQALGTYSVLALEKAQCPLLSPDCDHQFAFARLWGRAVDEGLVQANGQEEKREEKHMTNDTPGPSKAVCFSGFLDTNA